MKTPDAVIAFGFIGDEEEIFEKFDEDVSEMEWDALYAEKKEGIKASEGMGEEEYDAYLSRVEGILSDAGVEPIWTGLAGESETGIFFGVKDSQISALGFDVVAFDPKDTNISDKEIQNLKNFCKVVGIKYQEPKWHLIARLG